MLEYIKNLPVEILGRHVLGYLDVKDLVWLERASTSRTSRQLFLQAAPHCPAVSIDSVYTDRFNFKKMCMWLWFAKKKLSIRSVAVNLPGGYQHLYITMRYESVRLALTSEVSSEHIQEVEHDGSKVIHLSIEGRQRRKVMEQLSKYTPNVTILDIYRASQNTAEWLTAELVSNWMLLSLRLDAPSTEMVINIVPHCPKLTSIMLYSDAGLDDAAVVAIAQHCPKLRKLTYHIAFDTDNVTALTYHSLLALSEHGLFLEELYIPFIPHIPTADIAKRCSHALSCIRNIRTYDLHDNDQDATILIPYMTGLTRVELNYYNAAYIPLLTQHCHKLLAIIVRDKHYTVADILSLCCGNPLLQELYCYCIVGITDAALIELIHACPHIHTLWLPFETDITDIGILALSEHCNQLQELSIWGCHKVTEVAVLQLLQRCRKLTKLYTSSSSLSKETWTQLDSNTQKIVIRC